MCHFIKLVLPAQADVSALRDIVKRHGRALEPISEPRVDRELRPMNRSRCDAPSPAGSAERRDEGLAGRRGSRPSLGASARGARRRAHVRVRLERANRPSAAERVLVAVRTVIGKGRGP
jgi:hypothetical protein